MRRQNCRYAQCQRAACLGTGETSRGIFRSSRLLHPEYSGPVKVLPYVPETFELALKEILQALSDSGIPVLKRSLILDRTGPEAFLCVDADALDVKRLLVPLEDASKLGRLYDIDIIGRDGKKISRSDIGKPGRTCLLCERPARECSRSRTHSVSELTARSRRFLRKTLPDNVPPEIG